MDATSKERLHLAADGLYRILRFEFGRIPDHRRQPAISLVDALMAGFALFALKAPSLLAFEQERRDKEFNLKGIFGLDQIPSFQNYDGKNSIVSHNHTIPARRRKTDEEQVRATHH